MVIPGNLPSQLRVLDSSQQLYTSLFLASYCSSTHILSLKNPKKTLSFFSLVLLSSTLLSPPLRKNSSFPSETPLCFFFFSLFLFCISDLPSQRSLLQPPFCSHLFCLASLQPPFLSHSFCSFKKRG